jgi:NAD(P)H-hydrate epimerase
MQEVTQADLAGLYVPPPDSHKGQNGRLLIVGGSHLFHAASLWALTVASRIVDLVHYSSVPENNEIVAKARAEFRNGIVIPRSDIEAYIEEDDCILIGPGMTRDGETRELTDRLLKAYPHKQWVIDAGALQMVNPELIPENAVLTPHRGEFELLIQKSKVKIQNFNSKFPTNNFSDIVNELATNFNCIILLKGHEDIACSPTACRKIKSGNAGMTKGGTGDVLAGLIAALATKNEPYLATIAGSFINKAAGDKLFQSAGPYFNATDLANEIPKTMKSLIFT